MDRVNSQVALLRALLGPLEVLLHQDEFARHLPPAER